MDNNERTRSIKYKLKYPVTQGNETFTELDLKRLKVKQLRRIQAEKDPMLVAENMIEASAGIDPTIIGELDAEDFAEIQRVLTRFLGVSQQTS